MKNLLKSIVFSLSTLVGLQLAEGQPVPIAHTRWTTNATPAASADGTGTAVAGAQNASAQNLGTSIGDGSTADLHGVSIGNAATGGSGTIAIGYGALAGFPGVTPDAANDISIGYLSFVNQSATKTNIVNFGTGIANTENTFNWLGLPLFNWGAGGAISLGTNVATQAPTSAQIAAGGGITNNFKGPVNLTNIVENIYAAYNSATFSSTGTCLTINSGTGNYTGGGGGNLYDDQFQVPLWQMLDVSGEPLIAGMREGNSGSNGICGDLWMYGNTYTMNAGSYFSDLRIFGANYAYQFGQGTPYPDTTGEYRTVVLHGLAAKTNTIEGLYLLHIGAVSGNENPPYIGGSETFKVPYYADQYGKTFLGNVGNNIETRLSEYTTNHPHAWVQFRGQSTITPAAIFEPGSLSTNVYGGSLEVDTNGTFWVGIGTDPLHTNASTGARRSILVGTNSPYNGGSLTNLNGSKLQSGTLVASAINANSNPHMPAAVTLTGSVFTFSNATPNVLECYFSGSVAYSVTKNGVGVFGSLAADGYFLLQPTNQCAITYTVAPTLYTNSMF